MARLAGVTVGWLAAGETTVASQSQVSQEPTVRVPIYSARLGASGPGGGGEPTDEIVSYGNVWVRWLREEVRVDPTRAFIATVYGHSMLKLFADGDLVIGETVEELGRDGTYALFYDDEILVKHVRSDRQRRSVELISENPAFTPRVIEGADLERFHVIGRVAGKVTGHIV